MELPQFVPFIISAGDVDPLGLRQVHWTARQICGWMMNPKPGEGAPSGFWTEVAELRRVFVAPSAVVWSSMRKQSAGDRP